MLGKLFIVCLIDNLLRNKIHLHINGNNHAWLITFN